MATEVVFYYSDEDEDEELGSEVSEDEAGDAEGLDEKRRRTGEEEMEDICEGAGGGRISLGSTGGSPGTRRHDGQVGVVSPRERSHRASPPRAPPPAAPRDLTARALAAPRPPARSSARRSTSSWAGRRSSSSSRARSGR